MEAAQAGRDAPAPHPVMAGEGPSPTALPETAPQSAEPQSAEPQSTEPALPDPPPQDPPPQDPPPQDPPPQEAPADFPGTGAHAPDAADASTETASPDDAVRLAEALIFASAEPVSRRALTRALPEGTDLAPIIAALIARYAGRGVELAEIGSGLQFRTAADLAPLLRKVIEVPRRLPRVAMETLAIVAYHQPLTRSEIEELRGVSLSQATLDALLEMDLIAARGQRESPGRPTLWGTTPRFLAQFGLKDLRDLPRREDLLLDLPTGNDAPVSPAPASC
jgi:segregation and condensation protein B